MSRSNLEVFADTLMELASTRQDLLVVTGDSRGSARLGSFCARFPERVVEVGIAEQNLVGISAGLTIGGKHVFAVSPACFLTTRALDQIKNDIAYSNHPVKLVGISAGVSYGALGSTHHSLHDLATLLAIPNIDIVVPADNFETRQAVYASLDHPHPLYLRFGKSPLPELHHPEQDFEIGKAIYLREGSDLTFVALGETVQHALAACQLLETRGILAGVISFHSLRPFDYAALQAAVNSSGAIITVEEHSLHGGLGSLCASFLMEAGQWLPFQRVAIPDESTVTGSQAEIFRHYRISAEGLAQTALELLDKSKAPQKKLLVDYEGERKWTTIRG